MRIRIALVFIVWLGNTIAPARDNPLGIRGFPFEPKNMEIIWEVPTNQLPEKLWTYKVVPQIFSPSVISNAMAIGGFTEKDKKPFHVREYPFNQREMRRYTDAEENKYLLIFPPHGWIEYYTSDAQGGGRIPVEGVPAEDAVFTKALEVLASLGVNQSELATKPDTNAFRTYRTQGTHTRNFRDGRPPEKQIVMRGIGFVRKVGDYDISGTGPTGGFTVQFGNHGGVSQFTLNWRNLLKDKEVKTAPANEIINRINQGAFLALDSPSLLRGVGKLKIHQLTIKYSGAADDERQKISLPFARLLCRWETAETNVVFGLEGPILSSK